MLSYVVVAMLRKSLGERIVALHRTEEKAQRVARRFAAAHSSKFVRFRVKPMDLNRSQVESICFEWGRVDAADGKPLLAERLPKPYDAVYLAGYRLGKK